MKLGSLGAGVAAWAGAVLSSLCCLLPLTVIVLGLGSGAFMAVTMQYRWILIPTGVLGVVVGVALYILERRRCDALACRMAGGRTTLVLLVLASLATISLKVLTTSTLRLLDLVNLISGNAIPSALSAMTCCGEHWGSAGI